jgi:putative transposase
VTETIDTTIVMERAPGRALASRIASEELAAELLARAETDGVSLVGPGGLLAGLTKRVLEVALEAELTDHVGYRAYDPAGHHSGNSRNGTRTKTVLTDIGPVELDVPRDRAGTFEPVIVPKRQRRLGGVDQMVLSLSAKGLTHGEISAHLEDIYGAKVSKETITRITDRVLETMTDWQNRPLDAVYPVMFIDAIHVKVREGQVANRPIYVAIGVTVDGERDILGLWAGDGGKGEGAKYWAHVLTEIRNRGTKDVCIVVCDGLTGLPDAVRLGVAPGHRPSLRGPSAPQFVPLRQPPGLARDRQGPQAHLHGGDRSGRLRAFRRVRRALGSEVPRHRQVVGERLGRVRAVLELRSRGAGGDLHHQRHRVRERPDPQGGQGPRPLPDRDRRAQMRVPGRHEPRPHRPGPSALDQSLEAGIERLYNRLSRTYDILNEVAEIHSLEQNQLHRL